MSADPKLFRPNFWRKGSPPDRAFVREAEFRETAAATDLVIAIEEATNSLKLAKAILLAEHLGSELSQPVSDIVAWLGDLKGRFSDE